MSATADKISGILNTLGAPAKNVWVGQYTGIVTFRCHGSAVRGLRALCQAFKCSGPVKSIDYAKENKGTCLNPSVVDVWRVGFKI